MKKLAYQPPIVTVVEFKTERGFIASPQSQVINQLGLEYSRGADFSTGENFTEYTDNSGNFSQAYWD